MDWFDGAGNGSEVSASELLTGDHLSDGINELIDAGALISIGLTRDRGALGITVTVDGRWRREYFRDGEHALAWIAEAIPAVQAARSAQPASGVSGNGSRRRRGL